MNPGFDRNQGAIKAAEAALTKAESRKRPAFGTT